MEIFNFVDGALRTRVMNSTSKPEPLEKDKVTKFDLDIPVVWFGRPQPVVPGAAADAFGLTFGRMPGVQNLETLVRPIPPAGEAPSESAVMIFRAFASASQHSASVQRLPGPSLENLKPRYDLQQKMEILFGH